jgi:hypothetical protein
MKNLSLAILTATSTALAGCASAEPTDASSSAASMATPSGCAIAAAGKGELTLEFVDSDTIVVTFYDAKGRAYEGDESHTFQAEFRVRHNADGSLSALSRATGGGDVFTFVPNGSGYRLAFSSDNGKEDGYNEWESFIGSPRCTSNGIPALPVSFAPAAPKTVSSDASLDGDHLPKACTTTARNAKGELFELQIATKGWGPDTSYWTFVRYDAGGHADVATHAFGAADFETFSLQEFDEQDGADLGESPKVTIGEIAPKPGADGKTHFVLTPSDQVYHPKVHEEARLTDFVGGRPLELRCE